LSAAERRIRDAVAHGGEVDFRRAGDGQLPGRPEEFGPERTVRAEVLRALLLRTAADGDGIPALRVTGARISGRLDLGNAAVDVPVRFRACRFEQAPDLHAARTRQLNFTESVLPGLVAYGLHTDGALHLTRCRSTGPLRLTGARISGALLAEHAWLGSGSGAGARSGGGAALELDAARIENDLWAPGLAAHGALALAGAWIDGELNLLDAELSAPGGVCLHAGNATVGGGIAGARLSARGRLLLTGARVGRTVNLEDAVLDSRAGDDGVPGNGQLDGDGDGTGDGSPGTGEPALTATAATVDLDWVCPGLRARGEVRLSRARIAGKLDLSGAVLERPGDKALRAENLSVGAELTAVGLTARGCVDLRGAAVAGTVDLAHAQLSNDGGNLALRASGCTAAELSLRAAAPIRGTVNLRNARFDLLYADPGVWPETVLLNRLGYLALAPQLPARARLSVLERDADGFVPGAYEELAAAYVRLGDDDAARTVRLAAQRRRRAAQPWYARWWGHLQDAAVGYGYRPLRAAGWLAVLLAAGTSAFGLHHPPPLEPGKAPAFNPLVYTLDLLLPVVDFGQARSFDPHGLCQWLSYALVAAGWILAGTVAAGITRAVSRT